MRWTKGKLAIAASCTVLASTGLFGVAQAMADTNNTSGQTSSAGQSQQHRGSAGERVFALQLLKDAAAFLHVSPGDLHKSLAGGKSLNDVAAANNVSQADLQVELKTLVHNTLQDRVTNGKLTQEKEITLEQRIDARLPQLAAKTDFVKSARHHGVKRPMLGQIAKDLHLNPKDLLAKLKSGQTLADIAAAQGSSIQALTAQLQSAADAKINSQISDGLQRMATKNWSSGN